MTGLQVLQLTSSALCLGSAAMCVRQWRMWVRLNQHHHDEMTLASQAMAALMALIQRARPWLECDTCGGSLDMHDAPGVGVEMDGSTGVLRLTCASCSAAQHEEDHA